MRFSAEHIQMIRGQYPDSPEKDFQRFIFNAERLDLDPVLGQIQLIKRRSKDERGDWHVSWETLLGRDSYRILAERTGELDGSETVPNFGQGGELISATGTVWRKGKTYPFRETVYLSEYRSEISPFWKSKPITMLGKVAEAQALRKAFPALLTGIYAQEEMDAPIDRETGEILEPPAPTEKPKAAPPPAPAPTEKPKGGNGKEVTEETRLRKGLEAWIKEAGLEREAFKEFLFEQGLLFAGAHYGQDKKLHLRDLTCAQIQEIRAAKAEILADFWEWEKEGVMNFDLNSVEDTFTCHGCGKQHAQPATILEINGVSYPYGPECAAKMVEEETASIGLK